QFFNQSLYICQIATLQTFSHSLKNLFLLANISGNSFVSRFILLFIKRFTKTNSCLFDFLLSFLIDFLTIILNQHIGSISLFGIFIVNKWVVERIYVTRSLPSRRVHQNGSIYPHNVLVKLNHCSPPIFSNIFFEFYPVLCIVINRTQTIVNLTRRKNISVFFSVGNHILKQIFLLSHFQIF